MNKLTLSMLVSLIFVLGATLSATEVLAKESSAKDNSENTKNTRDDIYVSDNKLERVSVEWIDPKSFTDVRAADYSSERFRKRVFSQLEQHLDKLAQDLPAGQHLALSVTNVDLAGTIEPASFVGLRNTFRDIRVMRNIDIPRLSFHYELLDTDGAVLQSEDVVLKDMNYLSRSTTSFRDKPFEYEKKMLSKWFVKTIADTKA